LTLSIVINVRVAECPARYLAAPLDAIKDIIRKQPDFERFQLPPTEIEFYDLARYGPIVSFNVTNFNSHAFLIIRIYVRVLPLPKLVPEDIREHVSRDIGGNRSRRDAKLVSIDGSSKVEGNLYANT